jgi:hypothetical protein
MQLVGQVYIYFRYWGNFPSVSSYNFKTIFILPFEGSWYIANGGINIEASHSWDIYTQRYAYDFIILNNEKKSYHKNQNFVHDYYCFSKNIIAPANGKVVKIYNGQKDFTNVGDDRIDENASDIRGNFIIIKHSKNEYSLLAHLMKDTILVKKNEWVKTGQLIAKCGNSGHSTEPHLHFHLQNGKSFYFSAGLPILFKNFNVTKENFTINQSEPDYITKDFFVSNS